MIYHDLMLMLFVEKFVCSQWLMSRENCMQRLSLMKAVSCEFLTCMRSIMSSAATRLASQLYICKLTC